MMKALLIDPFTETVQVVDYSGDWEDIGGLLDCRYFDVVRIDDSETLYVDDEGLYVENQRFFTWNGYPNPLAGRGLILGTNEDGESIDTDMEPEDVEKLVTFLPEGTGFTLMAM